MLTLIVMFSPVAGGMIIFSKAFSFNVCTCITVKMVGLFQPDMVV